MKFRLAELVDIRTDDFRQTSMIYYWYMKLPLVTMLKIIIGMEGGSLNRELYDYDHSLDVTASAFVQQRKKILPEMFEYIFREFNCACSDDKTYRGYHLLAVDGSGVSIATNPDAPTYVENGSLAGYNCFHLNALYDLCNKTYVDAIIEPRPLYSEVRSARDMILRQKFDKAILIGDRGYGALNLMEHINRKDGLDYLIRVKEGWITETANLPIQEFDTDISFEIRTTQKNIDKQLYKAGKAKYIAEPSKFGKKKSSQVWGFESPCSMTIRIVRFKISEDTYETIATSLDRFQFPISEIKKLYHMRWGIETSFRELKYAVGLVNFHAKKEDYVLQEIWARLIMYNFCERITLSVVIEQKDCRKWAYQVNFTHAIHVCKNYYRHHSSDPPPDVLNLTDFRAAREPRCHIAAYLNDTERRRRLFLIQECPSFMSRAIM